MVHKLNPSSNFISIHSAKKMAAIPFLSIFFILSVVICILCLLFLACHVNILYSVLSIYHNKIFQLKKISILEKKMNWGVEQRDNETKIYSNVDYGYTRDQ